MYALSRTLRWLVIVSLISLVGLAGAWGASGWYGFELDTRPGFVVLYRGDLSIYRKPPGTPPRPFINVWHPSDTRYTLHWWTWHSEGNKLLSGWFVICPFWAVLVGICGASVLLRWSGCVVTCRVGASGICIHCGYDRRGSAAPVCTECGAA